jgi:hypothetical protein
MAVWGVDQFKAADVHVQLFRQLAQLAARANQDRGGNAVVGGFYRTQQCFATAGMGHGHGQRAQCRGLLQDIVKCFVIAGHGWSPGASRIGRRASTRAGRAGIRP